MVPPEGEQRAVIPTRVPQRSHRPAVGYLGAADPSGQARRASSKRRHARSDQCHLLCGPHGVVLATWHIRSKIRPFKRENSPNPPCKQRRVGVKSDLVNSIPLARMTLFSCYGEV